MWIYGPHAPIRYTPFDVIVKDKHWPTDKFTIFKETQTVTVRNILYAVASIYLQLPTTPPNWRWKKNQRQPQLTTTTNGRNMFYSWLENRDDGKKPPSQSRRARRAAYYVRRYIMSVCVCDKGTQSILRSRPRHPCHNRLVYKRREYSFCVCICVSLRFSKRSVCAMGCVMRTQHEIGTPLVYAQWTRITYTGRTSGGWCEGWQTLISLSFRRLGTGWFVGRDLLAVAGNENIFFSFISSQQTISFLQTNLLDMTDADCFVRQKIP